VAARHLSVERPARLVGGEGDGPAAGGEDLPPPLAPRDVLAVLGDEPIRVTKTGRIRRWGGACLLWLRARSAPTTSDSLASPLGEDPVQLHLVGSVSVSIEN